LISLDQQSFSASLLVHRTVYLDARISFKFQAEYSVGLGFFDKRINAGADSFRRPNNRSSDLRMACAFSDGDRCAKGLAMAPVRQGFAAA
jgi:hypothetical protein